MSATWVDVDPQAVSAYTADKADRLRDHSQLTRQADGPAWATWLVLGDSGLVYQITLRLHADRWTACCDHPRMLRQHQGLPVRSDQACSHMYAAAAAEAQARQTTIPVPRSPAAPPRRPAGATAGFYD